MTTKDQVQGAAFGTLKAEHKLYVCLTAVFVSCLLLGDVIGGKTITTATIFGHDLGPISVGIIPFPVTFLLTDVVNDFYGRRGARFLTFVGFGMALLAYVLLQIATNLQVHESTYFTDAEFKKIFGGSAQLFIASMIAYLVGQLLDIQVFQFWKALTQSRHLWLRATGSTLLSQVVDTVMINLIFWMWTAAADPTSFLGQKSTSDRYAWIFAKIGREYLIKVLVAVLLTPVVYAIHGAIVKWLDIHPEAHEKSALRAPRGGKI
ncbi:MAG: queuosine precursor transporter [Labilithrix sp.]|nr:queuosine precursor transporter [Labilithrix sp.]